MEAGDRDHRVVDRVNLARHYALKRLDDLAAGEQWVAALMRHRGVAALAEHPDRELVDRGHDRTGAHGKSAQRQLRPIVQAEHPLGREALEEALGDHAAAAAAVLAAELLGRLEDQVDGPVEVAGLREVAGGAEQHRRVPVMPTGVHQPGMDGRPGQARFLVDRQRVHVGAQTDRAAAGPRPDHADDARLRKARVNLVDAERAQLLGHESRGGALLEPELRMGVEMPAPGGEVVVEAGNAVDHGHGDASYAVPPTVIRSIRIVGWPTPTGTPWPFLPQVPTPLSSARSSPRAVIRCRASGPLPISIAPLTGAVTLPPSIR